MVPWRSDRQCLTVKFVDDANVKKIRSTSEISDGN